MATVAAIGSRDWSRDQLSKLTKFSKETLSLKFGLLNSGNADGSDQAFQVGFQGMVQVFLPWESYNRDQVRDGYMVGLPSVSDVAEAKRIWNAEMTDRPKWDSLKQSVQKLMARNYSIIEASDEVYAAPKIEHGEYAGGTKFGIVIAKSLGTPVHIIDFYENKLKRNVFGA